MLNRTKCNKRFSSLTTAVTRPVRYIKCTNGENPVKCDNPFRLYNRAHFIVYGTHYAYEYLVCTKTHYDERVHFGIEKKSGTNMTCART